MTSVEWLYIQMTNTWYDKESSKDLLRIAEKMHKREMEDFYDKGINDEFSNKFYSDSFEKHYNQKYGK